MPASGKPTRTISVTISGSNCRPPNRNPIANRPERSNAKNTSAANVLEIAVPQAAPAIPSCGNGPKPKMSSAFNVTLVGRVTSRTYIGVRVSPLPASAREAMMLQNRKATDSMTIRRYVAPSSIAFGSPVSIPISGSAYVHVAAVTGIEIPSAIHSDCLTARSALACSSAPLNRETTLMVPLETASASPNGTK